MNDRIAMLPNQTIACQALSPIGVPVSSPRTVSITGVIGWFSATARSHGGMVAVGTKALLT